MKKIKKRHTRIDRLEQDARRNRRKGSLGKWIYLLVLLGLLVWLLNYFLGNLIFFSAQGFVTREEFRVSVPYPARLASLDVEVGDDIPKGTQLARVDSLTIQETIAQIDLAVAELARERSRLEARSAGIDALLPLARLRATRMEGLLAQNTDAYERGLTTAINRSRLIEDEFDAAEQVMQLTAERGEIDRQIALIDQQRGELGQRRAVFADAYDDGIVRAPVDGQVFDISATVGSVVRAADPILTLIGGKPHILAYVNPGSLAELPVDSIVRIEYGVRELEGRITRVFPLSKQLPAEFQRQFRPQQRSQIIRIDFAKGGQIPPTFTTVKITSNDVLPSWIRRFLDEWQDDGDASRTAPERAAPPPARERGAERDRSAIPTAAEETARDSQTERTASRDATSRPGITDEGRSASPDEDDTVDEALMETVPGGAPADANAPDAAPVEPALAAARDADSKTQANAWRIQVAAFELQADARTELRRVRAAYREPPGLSYFIVRMALEDKTVYRIQLGPFAARSEALDHCAWLKDAGRDCFVLSPES